MVETEFDFLKKVCVDNTLQIMAWHTGVIALIMLIWSVLFFPNAIASRFDPTLVVTGMILILSSWVVIAAVLGVYVSSWWSYTAMCAVLTLLLSCWAVLLHCVFNAAAWEKVGSGAIGYMAPFLVFLPANVLVGLMRLLINAIR